MSGQTYEWHTVSSNPNLSTKVSNPSAAAAGTYYLYSISTVGNCYSPASSTPVIVSITSCSCTPIQVVIGSALTAGITGNNTTSGYTTQYVLTDANDVIVQGPTTSASFTPTVTGNYKIYAINYSGTVTGLIVGTNFLTGVSGSCMAKSAPKCFTVIGNPDIRTVKTASTTAITAGVPFSYTLTPSNVSTVASSGVITIKDTLQTGLTYNSYTGSGWGCTVSGQVVTCTSSSVINGNSSGTPLVLNVTPSSSLVGTSVTNTAWTSGGGMPGGPYKSGTTPTNAGGPGSPASGTPTVITGTSDIRTVKTASTIAITAGVPFSYTLTPSNVSTVASSGVITIKDTLQTGLTYNSYTGSGWGCTVSGQVVTCTSSSVINGNSSGTPLVLNVTPSSSLVGTSVTNTAWTSGGGMPGGPYKSGTTPTNAGGPGSPASGTPTVITGTSDIRTVKTASTIAITAGVPFSYTLTPSNVSTVASSGVITIKDTLQTGLTYNSYTGSGWGCTVSGQVVTCTSSSVINGNSSGTPLVLNVTPSSSLVGTSVTNTAWTSGGGMPGGPYKSGTTPTNAGGPGSPASGTPTVITGTSDIRTVKTASTTAITAGVPFSYTLTPSNVSTVASSGVITIKDTLQTGLTYNSYTGSGWGCTVSGQVVTCTSSSVINGNSSGTPLVLNVTPSSSLVGTSVTNTAWTSGGGMPGGPYKSGTTPTNAGGPGSPASGTPTVITGTSDIRTVKTASTIAITAGVPFSRLVQQVH